MRIRSIRWAWVVAALFLSAAPAVHGQCENLVLTGSESASGDSFGFSVDLSFPQVLVGAPFDPETGGAAYVFRLDLDNELQTMQQARLLAPDGRQSDFFGWSVAIDGPWVAVGAPFSQFRSTYMYRWDTQSRAWGFHSRIDLGQQLRSGWATAIRGDRLVIGAQVTDQPGAGAVHEYDPQSDRWIQTAVLIPWDGDPHDVFGYALALGDDRLLGGAPGHDALGREAGAAYLFRAVNGEWKPEAKLTAEDGTANDNLGIAVDLSDTAAIIGAWKHGGTGAAYIFRLNPTTGQWQQDAKLEPEHGGPIQRFGRSVALDGDTAVVGASIVDSHGVAFVYRREQLTGHWLQVGVLRGSDASRSDGFGHVLGLEDDRVLTGAPRRDPLGGVYFFDLDNPGDCTETLFHRDGSPFPINSEFCLYDLDHLRESDDLYLCVRRSREQSWLPSYVELYLLSEPARSEGVRSIRVLLETATDAVPRQPLQRVGLRDFTAGDNPVFVQIDERLTTLSDQMVDVTVTDDPSRFVDGRVEMLATWLDPGEVLFPAWGVRIDLVRWEVTTEP